MKLFISYARVDKHYCEQIIEMLDIHDIWVDRRLHAGQEWWEEILKQLNLCEGFIYLLSPDSVKSEYCTREYTIAMSTGKFIIPVLIHQSTPIPPALKHIQYADLSNGLDVKAVKSVLNAIYLAEKRGQSTRAHASVAAVAASVKPPLADPENVLDEAGAALDAQDFDRAVFLLKQAQTLGYESRFVDLKAVLEKAEAELERQSYLREAEREYRSIVALIKRDSTRELGVSAFQNFKQHFPDYDPDGLASICSTVLMPLLDWCAVPAGEVTVEYEKKSRNFHIDAFQISKCPVTTAQFTMFLEDPKGYQNEKWWTFSPSAETWHKEHPEPLKPMCPWGDHPRNNVGWYEAIAFCRWLSDKTGLPITLPTEQQWQRAAQGDDGRLYPWGNKFDVALCNTHESRQKTTTPVGRYPKGASPYEVLDMAGNVWEWCLNTEYGGNSALTSDAVRAVKGGSFIGAYHRARSTFRFYLNPLSRYATIGFRLVYKES